MTNQRSKYQQPTLPVWAGERITVNEILRRESRIEENRKRYNETRNSKNKYLLILGDNK